MDKVSKVLPMLKLIAEQQGLRLNRVREFNICKKILSQSVIKN